MAMRLLILLVLLPLSIRAANPSFGDFDATQFRTNGNKVSIKSGATLTNLAGIGTMTLNGSAVSTNGGSGLTNSGMTLNTLQKATGTNSIGDSSINDDGAGNIMLGGEAATVVAVFPTNNPNGDGIDLQFYSGAPG